MLMEGQWERKAVYTFYLELVRDLLHLSMYIFFFLVIFASDATCIICREEMVMAKKFLCGHLFHVHCLRSWLERQNTCPTCRALVVPPENGPVESGRQHIIPPDSRQHSLATAGTSTQVSEGGATGDNLSQSQQTARFQAAVLAASIYEKSFVYPPVNTFAWYASSFRT